MRQVCTVVAMVAACGFGFAVAPHEANAGPVPTVSAPAVTPTLTEQAGYWKRRWRNGYSPNVVVIPDAQVDLDVNGDVAVDAPAIIVLPPPRPLSCGEYHYWSGDRCVDARYNKPYIGPK